MSKLFKLVLNKKEINQVTKMAEVSQIGGVTHFLLRMQANQRQYRFHYVNLQIYTYK